MKKKNLQLTLQIILVIVLFYIPGGEAYSQAIYVDAGAAGANDGTSWTNAYIDLQDALNAATGSNEIWIAEGTYNPGSDREDSFIITGDQDGLKIYGGFAGGESQLNQRDPEANVVILSGDINGDDQDTDGDSIADTNQNDNNYHLMILDGGNGIGANIAANITNATVLSGVTITGGNANGPGIHQNNGGLYCDGRGIGNECSPTLQNIIFAGNKAASDGGALFNDGFDGGESNPVIFDITFIKNSALVRGGAIFNYALGGTASPAITNSAFSGNTAPDGGAIYNIGDSGTSSPNIINTIFSGNSASSNGGALFNTGLSGVSSPTIINTVFSGNLASSGGGIIYNSGEFGSVNLTMSNAIFWGNNSEVVINDEASSSISYSIIEGGHTGTGNLDENPLFTDADGADNIFGTADDNLHLTAASPAINNGHNQAYTDAGGDLNNDEDLAGNSRLFDGDPDPDIIDMGAYEFQGEPEAEITPDGNTLYVDIDVSGGDGSGSSWANAVPELRDALGWASGNWDAGTGGTLQIWVADGLYLPTGDDTDRAGTFQLIDGVEIYGGFAGTETAVGQRDWEANPTILSGDIDGDDTTNIITDPGNEIQGSNSYHVVTGSGTDATALLNGFIITAGMANGGSSPHYNGGGMVNDSGSPTLANVTFSGNSAFDGGGGMFNDSGSPTLANVIFSGNNSTANGGGMYNWNSSSPTLTGVTFSGNSAGNFGGGMGNDSSSPTLTGVTFSGNSTNYGGGMHNYNSSPTLTGVSFTGNSVANGDGGGMYNIGSSPTLTNVTFSGNSANDGGGIYGEGSSPTLTNVIFSGNSANLDGGGMINRFSSSPTLTGVTFSGNSAGDEGGGMYNSSSSHPTLANVIIWNNQANGSSTTPSASISGSSATISYSLIANSGGSEGWNSALGTDDGNNIDADPVFVNAGDPDGADNRFGTPDDGLALQNTSPAINAGSNQAYTDAGGDLNNDEDLAGNPRLFNGDPDPDIIDMGAYEFQGEPFDGITLTLAEGWRMLSSPIDGLTYDDMLGGLWTQGFPGSDYPAADFPNVYTWPNNQSGNNPADWVALANQADPIPAGTGFLIQVYADDDYDGTVEGSEDFDKTIPLSGTVRSGDVSPPMNTTPGGWTLVGNPYTVPVDFSALTKSGLSGAAHVYDGNYGGATPGPTNGNPGGWRSSDGTYGDLSGGVIAPGQGFFVQNAGSSGSLTFTEASQTTGGGFYGKEKELKDFVRLEVRGEAGVNSVWIRFSEEGSDEQMKGDALELQPYSEQYTLLGARKTDGTLLDIAHYPLPDETTEIPVSIEATQSGTFTLTATDLDLPAGTQLYLHDVETGETVLIDKQFEYSFTITNVQDQKDVLSSAQASRSTAGGPMKATPSEADRFLITTSQAGPTDELPEQVALNQNYPNPFNPSTVISYQLPVNSEVRLEVFDLIGRQVATLVEGRVEAGKHVVNFDASHLTSGLYLYRLSTHGTNGSNKIFTKKLTLIK